MEVYVIIVNGRVSIEGYDSEDKAIAFIESRSDHPEKINGWLYKSKRNQYTIHSIAIK